jgi:hypothetical protein
MLHGAKLENDYKKWIGKDVEVVMAYFKVLSKHPGGIDENLPG